MTDSADSLAVIGAGALGARVAKAWRERFPGAKVIAETAGTLRHDSLRAAGFEVRVRADEPPPHAANVLFCAPPSNAADYEAEARRAVSCRSGGGGLVFTSSTGVYPDDDIECDEDSATIRSPRSAPLLDAEAAIREAGGAVVRLAGLYDAERGPHRVFGRMGVSERRGDGRLNLIHYNDAADLCVAALLARESGAIYMGCDGSPITREALARAWSEFRGAPGCRFTGVSGSPGRACRNERTRARLGLRPRYASFVEWAASGDD